MKNKVIIFNPKSANSKHRIPNSILQIGASIHDQFDYVLVDGNLEKNPLEKILYLLSSGEFRYFCSTVMPGPQLRQAIPFTQRVKENFPKVINIWGGYFASNQYQVCMDSGYVDFIINGPGDIAFPSLLKELENKGTQLSTIKNLIYRDESGTIIKTDKEPLLDQNKLAPLPYTKLNEFYPVKNYLAKTFMGSTTLSYHSSMGCPFTCSFCAIVPISMQHGKENRLKASIRMLLILRKTTTSMLLSFMIITSLHLKSGFWSFLNSF